MAKSKIEWTENTWNPVTGCTKISDGCKNCYAAVMAQRLKLMGNKKYVNGFDVTLPKRADRLEEIAPYLTWGPNIWQGVATIKELAALVGRGLEN